MATVQALSEVVPSIAEAKIGAGGFMVLRPDSGDPVEAVLAALEAAEKVFGADVNSRGYKVPRGCGVIQGDGINLESLSAILRAVLNKGYSAQVRTASGHIFAAYIILLMWPFAATLPHLARSLYITLCQNINCFDGPER